MMHEQYICKNCILIDGSFGIELNSEGICNYCEDPAYKTTNWWKTQITEKMKETGLRDWNSVIELMHSRQEEKKYDCIVGYSGGKDSTALLYTMVHDYGFNPLAVTIDSGFIPEIAFENIKDTLKKISVDHVVIDGAKETFRKLYQWVFTDQDSNDLTLTRNLCDNCGDLVHSLVVREAMKRDIDIILFGYSPDEIRRYFYEIPQHEIEHDWKPSFINRELFTEEDRNHYFTPEDFENHTVPRIILPYHVIDYNEEDIIQLIESKNLVKKGNSSTLKTSCHVIAAALFYDLNRFGALPYALQFAELIRQDPSIRKKWLITLKRLTPMIREGKFNESGVNFTLEKIGLSRETLLSIVQNKVNQDPNRDKIIRNLNLF
ncbi:hypothetical protein ES703_109075 [subsurface metagenome]